MRYSESDTRANFIDPLLSECGWKPVNVQREYYFTDGHKILNNKRGRRKFVDYLLKHRNVHLAIVEAKSSDKHPTEGLQQAIDYANDLHVRFVYSSNGLKHYEFDTSVGNGDYIERFPSPDDLFRRVTINATAEQERLLVQPMDNSGTNQPRYYQTIAVNKAIEAISGGRKRVLLTLATGTGYVNLMIM